ncbi:uncharacterized protein LOC143887890 [Tasmannia lanceolata]|uniref:uncharacterized protein LOC143887890 n=1 Tax=Tasmannia lanceolata TaxID=3420 RepID=UPI0040637C0B
MPILLSPLSAGSTMKVEMNKNKYEVCRPWDGKIVFWTVWCPSTVIWFNLGKTKVKQRWMMMSGRRNKGRRESEDEVEELLRAAEDAALLKINIDAHTTRSQALDQHLLHRFKALKTPSPPPPPPKAPLLLGKQEITTSIAPSHEKEEEKGDEELGRILGADLSARFYALKGSSFSSSSSTSREFQEDPSIKFKVDKEDEDDVVDEDGVSKREVERLMQWAMDAARLDPSPTDEDDDDDAIDDGDGGDDDDYLDIGNQKKEGSKKEKDKK